MKQLFKYANRSVMPIKVSIVKFVYISTFLLLLYHDNPVECTFKGTRQQFNLFTLLALLLICKQILLYFSNEILIKMWWQQQNNTVVFGKHTHAHTFSYWHFPIGSFRFYQIVLSCHPISSKAFIFTNNSYYDILTTFNSVIFCLKHFLLCWTLLFRKVLTPLRWTMLEFF